MSQLSFDGFIDKQPDTEVVPEPIASKESWYKGRVLSHSSVSLYRSCPQKWKFRYVDKVPEKPRSFFSFGKSVHNSLEFLFSSVQKERPLLEEMLNHYKSHWLSEGYETPAQEKWFFQEGERILRGFYAKHHADFEKILKVEFKFTIDVDGVPITGFIDRVDSTPNGGLALLDYKTGKAFDKSRVRTDSQLTLYQMAARSLLGKSVESVTLYHLNSLTPLTVPAHSKKQEDSLSVAIVETAKGIMEGRFEPKMEEKGQCQWCDYQQICPAFSGRKTIAAPAGVSDAVSTLVDRVGKLEERIKDLSEERDLLKESISSHMRAAGRSEAEGRHFSARLESGETGEAPALTVRKIQDKTIS